MRCAYCALRSEEVVGNEDVAQAEAALQILEQV
jgi:hypothetical protein